MEVMKKTAKKLTFKRLGKRYILCYLCKTENSNDLYTKFVDYKNLISLTNEI